MKWKKIPGRKHHGVRDPERQRAERFKLIKDKINAPPSNPDDQQVSKSLQRFSELRDKVKKGDYDRKPAKKAKNPSQFQQLPTETDRQFMWRVQKHCSQIKHEAAFAEKFKVDIKRDKSGEIVSVEKRAKDPIEQMVKEAKNELKKKKQKKKKKKGGEEVPAPRLNKSQKRQAKIKAKKAAKEQNKGKDFDKYDVVQFGEHAHAPPALSLPKKAKNDESAPRPGKKDLLLKSMLEPTKTANKVIDKTGKRKELPNALRRQLDRQQAEIVEAYRSLKSKKYNQT